MVTLLDVNILVALCDADHQHHLAASLWFTEYAEAGWASCPMTQNGVLRILSSPAYPNARPPKQVIEQLQPLFATKVHRFWPDDLSLTDATRFAHRYLIGHRQITHAYLPGLAVKNRGRLLSKDGSIASNAVVGARREHLIGLQ